MLDLLNLEPNKVSTDIDTQNYLLAGLPKTGKTTTSHRLMGDKMLLLAFEQGYHLISNINAVPVKSHSDLRKIIKQLKDERVREKYSVICFDTVDLFHLMMEKYLCSQHGADDIGGCGAMGKGYTLLDNLIQNTLLEISNLGYKMLYISHAEVVKETIKTPQGMLEIEKIYPSISKQSKRTYKIISKFVDHIFTITNELDENGEEVRKMYTRNNRYTFGGTRLQHLPEVLPLDTDIIKDEIRKALEKEENTTTERKEIDYSVEKLDFEKVKSELIELVTKEFQPSGRMDIAKSIIEKHLGTGATVGTSEPNQVEALNAVLIELDGMK
ncbi:MAG: AAA family ATPase [Sarcina sp.]